MEVKELKKLGRTWGNLRVLGEDLSGYGERKRAAVSWCRERKRRVWMGNKEEEEIGPFGRISIWHGRAIRHRVPVLQHSVLLLQMLARSCHTARCGCVNILTVEHYFSLALFFFSSSLREGWHAHAVRHGVPMPTFYPLSRLLPNPLLLFSLFFFLNFFLSSPPFFSIFILFFCFFFLKAIKLGLPPKKRLF